MTKMMIIRNMRTLTVVHINSPPSHWRSLEPEAFAGRESGKITLRFLRISDELPTSSIVSKMSISLSLLLFLYKRGYRPTVEVSD